MAIRADDNWKQENGKYQCPHCQKEYNKRGIGFHIWRNHTEEGQKHDPNIGYENGTREGWCKGMTSETDERVRKRAETLRDGYDSGKITPSFKGRELTEDHKNKISISRKKFIQENPDKAPYVMNHYSKGPSYPERYFSELFENENILLTPYHRMGLYELDFADLENKIAIEIDGEQHYVDKRIVESDKRKDAFLEEGGWLVYRIRWATWQKKTLHEKHLIVEEIKKLMGL